MVAAFPAEIQNSVCAQLADCLVAVIAQRLRFRPDLNIRVPECEILMPNNPVKAHIRSREFFKIISDLEIGAEAGMWTWDRYRRWLEKRTQWSVPGQSAEPPDSETNETEIAGPVPANLPPLPAASKPAKPEAAGAPKLASPPPARIEIEPVEGGLGELIKKLGDQA